MRSSPSVSCARRRTAGFTLTELLLILVILGILAAVAIPRFFDRRSFDTLAFYDRVQAAVRYAQKVAIAQRRLVLVMVTGNTLSVCYDDTGCAARVIDPTTGQPFSLAAPGGVTLSATPPSFSFNGLGQTNLASMATLSVVGDSTRSFFVEAETGYVHP